MNTLRNILIILGRNVEQDEMTTLARLGWGRLWRGYIFFF